MLLKKNTSNIIKMYKPQVQMYIKRAVKNQVTQYLFLYTFHRSPRQWVNNLL